MIITVISSDKAQVSVYRTGMSHIGTVSTITMNDDGCTKTEKALIRRDEAHVWHIHPANTRDGEVKRSRVSQMVQNALTTPVQDLLTIMARCNPDQPSSPWTQNPNMGCGNVQYGAAAFTWQTMPFASSMADMESIPLHANFTGVTMSDSKEVIQLTLSPYPLTHSIPMWSRVLWSRVAMPISLPEEELLTLIDQHIS
jgi:hypothetical protein